jgi:hypothetical protein
MNYSDKHKILWATPRRTATRSCIPIQEYFKFDLVGQHELQIPKDKKDYYFIFNTRNPYNRMVSLYHLFCFHSNLKSDDFGNWIRQKLLIDSHRQKKSDYQTFLSVNIQRKPDLIIRIENLYHDILKIPILTDNSDELFEIIDNNILKNNYLSHNDYKKFYNQDLADTVYSYLEEDFLYFDYDKDSWKNGTS